MSLQKWIRTKQLNNPLVIKELKSKYGIMLSTDLENCIQFNNGAKPRPNIIMLKNGEENDVKALLSYNDGDPENIFNVIEFFAKKYQGALVPFASDSAGNYYCEQGKRIVLWTQNNEILPVCNSFSQFLDSLYELK